MARSYRKTPITGFTKKESEAADKKIWHSRMRTHERIALSDVDINGDSDVHVPEDSVSSTWDMAKDGKQYWPEKAQIAYAEAQQAVKGIKKLKKRLLHKFKAK